jgi:hypothetical protein
LLARTSREVKLTEAGTALLAGARRYARKSRRRGHRSEARRRWRAGHCPDWLQLERRLRDTAAAWTGIHAPTARRRACCRGDATEADYGRAALAEDRRRAGPLPGNRTTSPTSRSGASRWSPCSPPATRSRAKIRSGSTRWPTNRCSFRAKSLLGCTTSTSTPAAGRVSSPNTATSLRAHVGCSRPGTPPRKRSYPSQFPATCLPVPLPCQSAPRKTRSRCSSVWRSENQSAALAALVGVANAVFAAVGQQFVERALVKQQAHEACRAGSTCSSEAALLRQLRRQARPAGRSDRCRGGGGSRRSGAPRTWLPLPATRQSRRRRHARTRRRSSGPVHGRARR